MAQFFTSYNVSDKWVVGFKKSEFNGKNIIVFGDKSYDFDEMCGIKCQITSGSYYAEDIANHVGMLWLFSQLPAMYEAAAKPWEKVGNITMYSGGKDGGDSLLTGNITKTITQVGAGLKDSLGIDLGDVVKGLVGGKLVGSEVAKALSTKDNA